MRKIILAILLAGAAATQTNAAPPAQQSKDERPKAAHQGRAEGGRRAPQSSAERRVVNPQVRQQANRRAPEASPTNQRRARVQRAEGQANVPAQAERRKGGQKVQTQAGDQQRRTDVSRVRNRSAGQPINRMPNIEHRRPPAVSSTRSSTGQPINRTNVERRRQPVVSSTPRFGAQPPLRAQRRPTPRPQWTTNWRNNQRYNWNDWRRRNRSVYHQHSYHDPFGWAYQTFSIGWRLWPNYYSSSYWINDPGMYRLPPAPPGTRWIRYYNDALLVDMWSGEVLDVIHNFFW